MVNQDHSAAHGGDSIAKHLHTLWALCRQDTWVVVIYAIFVGLLSLSTPIAVQSFVTTIAFGSLLQPIVILAVFVFVGLSFVGLMRALQLHVVEIVQQRMFVYAARRIMQRLPQIPSQFYRQESLPELINRFLDVATLQKSVAVLLIDGVGVILQTLIGLIVLAFYHPFFLAFDLILIAVGAVVIVALGRGAVSSSIQESKAKYAVHAWLEEVAQRPLLFRSAAARQHVQLRLEHLTGRYLHHRSAHYRVLFRQIAGSLVFQAVMNALLLGLGGYLVLEKQLTIGQLVAAELIVSTLVYGLTKFVKQLESFYDLMAAVEKLSHLFDLPASAEPTHPLPPPASDAPLLALRTLSYQSPHHRPLVDVTLEIKSHGRLAIWSSSGEAHSDLAQLLSGHLDAHSPLLIHGINAGQYSAAQRAQQVVYLPESQLFQGSLRDNLTLGDTALDERALFDALKTFGVDDWVRRLPDGLEMMIDHVNSGIPAEVLHRLCLARTALSSPACVIVDEPFSHVGPEVRAALLDLVLDPRRPWAVVIVTCDKQQAARAGQVYALRDGHLRLLPQGELS